MKMKTHDIRAVTGIALLVGAALVTAPASAQSGQATDSRKKEQETLQEVTVTAERFEATVQTSPVAITALDSTALESRAVTNVLEAMSEIPGITITPVQSSNTSARVYLRGAGQNSAGINFDPAVGIYIDNVYQPRVNGAFFDFFDIRGMEVLRGPQGTLYGRNTSGGALKIETRRPSFDWTGSAQLSGGNWNAVGGKGYLSGPIVDGKLAFSVSGVYRKRDGFLYSTEYKRQVGNIDSRAERLRLMYTPSDELEINLSAFFIQDYSEAAWGVPLLVQPAVRNPSANGTFNRDLTTTELFGSLGASRLNNTGASLNIKYDASDNLTLNSISGYGSLRSFSNGNTIWVFAADQARKDAGQNLNVPSANEGRLRDTFFTEELNATYSSDKLKGVVGVFYIREKGSNRASVASSPTTDQDRITTASAVFGQATYNVTDTVGLTAGLRYTQEEADFTQFFRPVAAQNRVKKYRATTPKFGINWQPTHDLLAYASYTKGFKSGGFNPIPPGSNTGTGQPGQPTPYDPETVKSYEVGVKWTAPSDLFRINVAAYKAEYHGLQFPVFFPGTTTIYTSNATDGEVSGIEVEPTWQATDHLQVYGNGSFTTGKYTSDWFCFGQFGQLKNCGKGEIPGQIPTKTTVGLRYYPELPIPGRVSFNGSWVYHSKYFNNVANEGPLVQAQSANIYNVTVNWATEDNRYNAALDIRNLGDTHYVWSGLQSSHPTTPSVTGYVNSPREIVFRVGVNF
jgi:iron complex outermembrane recepter protein